MRGDVQKKVSKKVIKKCRKIFMVDDTARRNQIQQSHMTNSASSRDDNKKKITVEPEH